MPCNLTHMCQTCSKLSNNCNNFFNLSLTSWEYLLVFGVPPDELMTTSLQKNVIAFASLIVCRKIILLWKSPPPPSFKSWLHDFLFLLKLEKIKFSLRGCSEKFPSHWKPLLDCVDKLPATETSPWFNALDLDWPRNRRRYGWICRDVGSKQPMVHPTFFIYLFLSISIYYLFIIFFSYK